jgi:hypothetical protein
VPPTFIVFIRILQQFFYFIIFFLFTKKGIGGGKPRLSEAGRRSDAERIKNGLEAEPELSFMFSYIPSKLINFII